jgi:hypothetical protein
LLAIPQGHAFVSAEQLAAYLGLVPVERQSGTSLRGRARLSKAGPTRVRAALYRAAVVASRYNPPIKGTRVTLRTLLASLAEGASIEEITADFPAISADDVCAVIAFGAASAEEDLPLPAIPEVA